jgi:acetyl-CoA carboxylase carboxyl transferase subunit alpha
MDPGTMADNVSEALRRHLKQLRKSKPDALITRRYKKFRAMGVFNDR